MPSADLGASGGRRRGFTLIEVVVAVVILGSALVAWTATFGAELLTLVRARGVAVAVELAEDRLAAVELYALERLPNLPDSLRSGTFAAPFADYRWEADAVSVAGRPLAEVTVIVQSPRAEHRLATVLPLPSLRTVTR